MSTSIGRGIAAGLIAVLASTPAAAQNVGRIAGHVLTAVGTPAEGVSVRLVELRRKTATNAAGEFRFDEVPPGRYLLRAENLRFGRHVARVEVVADQESTAELILDVDVHHETVVVSTQPDARSGSEVARPVAVLAGEDLRLRLEPTLGETVSQLPGVSSTYFGPGASRPIIRGVGGDRIRVLEDGIGTFDASSTSPDHAVSFDPLGVEQVEVVRGPATLLYGSSAVGGVVNTIDHRIPDAASDHTVTGIVDLAGASAAEDLSGAAALQVGRGPLIGRADFVRRQSEDVAIPGVAESAALRAEEAAEGAQHEQATGVLENSALESTSASASASLVGERGFVGVSVRGFDSLYGVPGGHGHEGEEAEAAGGEEAPVRIDLEQRRLDLRGGHTQPFGAFRSAKVRLGVGSYRHRELEGGEVGTTFESDGWEGRVELLHKPIGSVSGSFGVQILGRDFSAVGAEAFLPPTETRSWALFVFEEIGTGALRGQLGTRYERQDVEAFGAVPQSRSLDGLSGSAGLVWKSTRGFSASATLARSVKLPNAEELYSDGPHVATRAFEVGDPGLDREASLGLDVKLSQRSERFTGEVTFFTNHFDDYIYEELTGEARDGLALVRFVQRDARFSGAEIDAHVDLLESEPHHLDLEVSGDLVRAELADDGEDLPRIPPARYRVGLHYGSSNWNARVEVRGALEQTRVGPFERPTAGYALLNASVGYRIFAGKSIVDLMLRGTNLADQEARVHSSFLKDVVPLPGRDFRLNARVTF